MIPCPFLSRLVNNTACYHHPNSKQREAASGSNAGAASSVFSRLTVILFSGDLSHLWGNAGQHGCDCRQLSFREA